jgi:hypothetical protein
MTTVEEAYGAPLVGRRVRLERLAPRHIDALYEFATQDQVAGGWPLMGETMSPVEFFGYLWSLGPIQFAAVRRDAGVPVGLVQGIDEDARNGTIAMGFFLDPELWASGWPLEAVVLFLEYLLQGRGYRKVYVHLPASLLGKLGGALGTWLDEECVLHRHVRVGDDYEDVSVFSVSRHKWDSAFARRLTGNAPAS